MHRCSGAPLQQQCNVETMQCRITRARPSHARLQVCCSQVPFYSLASLLIGMRRKPQPGINSQNTRRREQGGTSGSTCGAEVAHFCCDFGGEGRLFGAGSTFTGTDHLISFDARLCTSSSGPMETDTTTVCYRVWKTRHFTGFWSSFALHQLSQVCSAAA